MKRRGSALWYAVIIALVLALAFFIALAIYHISSGNRNSASGDAVVSDNSDDRTNAIDNSHKGDGNDSALPQQSEGVEVFVMFGVDSRGDSYGKGTHCDTLMLVRVDHDLEEVRVVSIYRDCMLYQEGRGYKKITDAHAYGGSEYTMKTLNENFDLAIEDYCTVNFNSVGDLIDMVGGVEMEITEDEVEHINGYIDELNRVRGTTSAHITEPGVYLLDGTQAVAYSRIRYTVGWDFKRTERQRDVLFKVFETAKDMGQRDRLEIAGEMLEDISTNYSKDEILVLMYYISEYEITTMTAYPQVFYGGTVEGAWVEVPVTLVDMNTELHKILLNDEAYVPSERVQEISDALSNKVSGPNVDQRDDGE